MERVHSGAPQTRKFGFRGFKTKPLVLSLSPSLLSLVSLFTQAASGNPQAFLSHPVNQIIRPSLFYFVQTDGQKPGKKLDWSYGGFLPPSGSIILGREIGSHVWLNLHRMLSSLPKRLGAVTGN